MRFWSHPGYEHVARLVNAQYGTAFGASSAGAAEAATRRVMERLGLGDVSEYADLLVSGGASLADLMDELAVGETWFFRQPGRFELIRGQVIPALAKRRPSGILRAWSAGCSTGEEAYSLAILFEEAAVGERWQILATDVSRIALERAERAAYGIWSLRGLDESLARRHFHRVGSREVLDDRIRRRVTFRHDNLAATTPLLSMAPRSMNLILCCNVLMYFDRATTRRVARRFYDALADGGWLLTGASDPCLSEEAPFESIVTSRGVTYRRAGRVGRRAREQGPPDDREAVCD